MKRNKYIQALNNSFVASEEQIEIMMKSMKKKQHFEKDFYAKMQRI